MISLKTIQKYLDDLLDYDWKTFDKLDALAQGTIWRKIASDFKILLMAYQENRSTLKVLLKSVQ